MTELRPSGEPSASEARLLVELRKLYVERGEPSYRDLARDTGRAPSTISSVLSAGRVTSLPIVLDVVRALGGDVERFERLFQLIRSERQGLEDRADELSAELGLPASQHVQHTSTTVHSTGGTVYIQSGGPLPFSPLSVFAPAELVTTYESACLAHASGAHMAAMSLTRTLIEAVGARERGRHSPTPLDGVDFLREQGVISARLAEKGYEVWAKTSEVVRGLRAPRPDDSAAALAFALALLSCAYLDGRR
ncbi:hypothetical protein ACIGNX_19060 [Actinosynnema sp. NPDC053489]|uniref:hypothetical protein n=1 Tax=Actinosynnema sp. NPDC053489 TaxID=3363916 RepID=UPI0037C7EA2C